MKLRQLVFITAFAIIAPRAAGASPSAKNFDSDMSGCEMACGSKEKYNPSDIKKQSEAKLGDFVQCPVSGAVFKLKFASETISVDGKKRYACCAACAQRFEKNPGRYAGNLE